MREYRAPGWTADWISGWLAAIGVVVLCEDVKLSWSKDSSPVAIFTTDVEVPLPEHVASAFPERNFLNGTSLKESSGQVPTISEYETGAADARMSGDWVWSSAVTDLGSTEIKKGSDQRIQRSQFYPGVPGKMGLIKRISDIAKISWADPVHIEQSMNGTLKRAKTTGLGFDSRRMVDPAMPNAEMRIDPVVESLAFFATLLFPVRGDGRRTYTRGEQRNRSKHVPFRWKTWTEPMNIASIDAAIGTGKDSFEIVSYQRRGNETNSAYFSRRINE
jgi:hypothetical protein